MVTSSAEHKPSTWDTVTTCEDRHFNVIYGLVISCKTLLLYRTIWVLTRVLFFLCVHLIYHQHQNIPLVSTQRVRHSSTYVILYILHRINYFTHILNTVVLNWGIWEYLTYKHPLNTTVPHVGRNILFHISFKWIVLLVSWYFAVIAEYAHHKIQWNVK